MAQREVKRRSQVVAVEENLSRRPQFGGTKAIEGLNLLQPQPIRFGLEVDEGVYSFSVLFSACQ